MSDSEHLKDITRPTYHDLDSLPRCIADNYARVALENAQDKMRRAARQDPIFTFGYPLPEEFEYARIHLRDVALAVQGYDALVEQIVSPSHPEHEAYRFCAKAFGLPRMPKDQRNNMVVR